VGFAVTRRIYFRLDARSTIIEGFCEQSIRDVWLFEDAPESYVARQHRSRMSGTKRGADVRLDFPAARMGVGLAKLLPDFKTIADFCLHE
jgi:hypothetical protein